MDLQPAETTLFSLSEEAPLPPESADRRDGQRHMTLFRVGSYVTEDRRELCLIKNISAGGMMIRAYCPLKKDARLTIELKSGQPIQGRVTWIRDDNAGIAFEEPVDVIDILSNSMEGPRPRMPRIETDCVATMREGANAYRVTIRDVSQGGAKASFDRILPAGTEVVLTIPGMESIAAVTCWSRDGFVGISFNKLLPLRDLVDWLNGQRANLRQAS